MEFLFCAPMLMMAAFWKRLSIAFGFEFREHRFAMLPGKVSAEAKAREREPSSCSWKEERERKNHVMLSQLQQAPRNGSARNLNWDLNLFSFSSCFTISTTTCFGAGSAIQFGSQRVSSFALTFNATSFLESFSCFPSFLVFASFFPCSRIKT